MKTTRFMLLLSLLAVSGCESDQSEQIRMEDPDAAGAAHIEVEPADHDPNIGRPYTLDDEGNKVFVD